MWESRVLRRAFERLELHEGKLSHAVLRGGGGGDVTSLPDAWVVPHPGLPGPDLPRDEIEAICHRLPKTGPDPAKPRLGGQPPRSTRLAKPPFLTPRSPLSYFGCGRSGNGNVTDGRKGFGNVSDRERGFRGVSGEGAAGSSTFASRWVAISFRLATTR